MYSLHALELVQLDPGPVALYILGMNTGLWVYKVETVIYSSVMGNMRKLLYTPICSPLIRVDCGVGVHMCLNDRQQCGCISLSN